MEETVVATYTSRGSYFIVRIAVQATRDSEVVHDIISALDDVDSAFHFENVENTDAGTTEIAYVVPQRIPFHAELIQLCAAMAWPLETNADEF